MPVEHLSNAKPARHIETPSPGSPFSIAWQDLVESLERSSVWIHAGWIDIVWQFRRTLIGPFWHTISLAAFVIVMGVLWGSMLGQDPVEHFRFVGTGLIVWTLISSFIMNGAGCLISGQGTALQTRFPYMAFAFGNVWRALLLFGHHIVLYILLIVFTLHWPGWKLFLVFPAMLLLLANGIWVSLLFGMMSLRRRDLVPAVSSAMQIMMFVTPVFWPKDRLGSKLAYIADLNPLYHMMRILRDPMLGLLPPLTSWMWTGGSLIVGTAITFWFYGRYRDRFAYWY
ncbi:ABC transporter permease [Rhodospirillum sp. A1_3_36]|uniref:ABC transporter permease n=1 Tax=Rhodospirillum sp. A1_3_36 TaxID=3391666 RepID=UPI0039A46856